MSEANELTEQTEDELAAALRDIFKAYDVRGIVPDELDARDRLPRSAGRWSR